MTNLSIHICDTSASLVLTSASFADRSISSSWAPLPISTSWAGASLFSTSASFAPPSISSSWASSSLSSSFALNAFNANKSDTSNYSTFADLSISSSWAPSPRGLTVNTLCISPSTGLYEKMEYVNGILVSASSDNVLNLCHSSSIVPIFNPTGSINLSGPSYYSQYDVNPANWITSIIGHHCVNLISLDCHRNSILTLDLSGSSALTYLDCSTTPLSYLNILGATSLIHLDCSNNGGQDGTLRNLDLSTNTALTYFNGISNEWTINEVGGIVYNILNTLITNGQMSGSCIILGQYPMGNPPPNESISSLITTLQNRGWTVS